MRIMVTITPICSTAISEDIVQNINKSFPLCTTCLSTTNSLVYRAAKLCNEEKTAAFERFAIKYDGYFYNIRKNCPLKRLLLFLGNSNAITLYYRIGIGDTTGLGLVVGLGSVKKKEFVISFIQTRAPIRHMSTRNTRVEQFQSICRL